MKRSRVWLLVAIAILALSNVACGNNDVTPTPASSSNMVTTLQAVGDSLQTEDSREPSFLCTVCASGKSNDDGQTWANAVWFDVPTCNGICSMGDVLAITGYTPQEDSE